MTNVRALLRLACTLALLSALASCVSVSTTSRKTLAVGAGITLQPGERALLPDGSTLRYVAVAADSRCPEKVQCVWAGDADLLFELAKRGSELQQFHLHSGIEPKSFRATGHIIFLDAVTRDPGARATLRFNP